MRHMAVLNAAFGAARVLGGVALVATQLDDNGDIVALTDSASLTVGTQDGQRTPAVQRSSALLSGAGFPVAVQRQHRGRHVGQVGVHRLRERGDVPARRNGRAVAAVGGEQVASDIV